MIDRLPRLTTPGLFVTGTDTGVGKTVVTCAIAAALREQRPGWRVGVCKPFSSGCRREREGLVHEDAEALAHFADCRLPLDVINPIRFAPPLAPAVAAEQKGKKVDWALLARALHTLDDASDALLVEGVGGLLVPLDPDNPKCTVLELISALGLPTVVVTRAGLGTLNHTAMTVRLLREAGCVVAGLVINGYDPDAVDDDPAITTNRRWLTKMTGAPVLAVLPKVRDGEANPSRARLDGGLIEAAGMADWVALMSGQ
ncbi:dethiobiotin synthase [Phycisphaerales bacterium AB-hyl4]|uniref:ATP-dependent dethiobiotin synthetase BioD n=1 Tax=Natronomicrosphaera hydrolytica TaxID=3242702 RepID=A0ABV4U6E2_9BACT